MVICSKKDKFKNNKNAHHENIDFYNMTHMRPVAEIHFFRWGGQNLLNFRQNFQISDIPPPPPFALEKTVFSPLLGQNFRKFVNFP
jgi:hypothetical protein